MADPSLYSQFRLFFSGREGEFLDRFSGPQFCPIPLRRHGNVQRLTDLMDGNIGNFIPFCHLCYRHGPDFLIQGLPVIHIIGSSKLFNRFQWIDSHLSGLCLRRLLRSCLYRRRCTGRPGSSFLLKLMFLCICGTGQSFLYQLNDCIPVAGKGRLLHGFSVVEFGPVSRGRNRDLGRLDRCQTFRVWDAIFFGYTCHGYVPDLFVELLSCQTNLRGRHRCSYLLVGNYCLFLFNLKGMCF